MGTGDGHRIVGTGHTRKSVNCTRWAELTDSVRFHAGLAEAAQARTEFRLLNRSNPILLGTGNSNADYQFFLSQLEGSPSGGTPLCRHIVEVTAQIEGKSCTVSHFQMYICPTCTCQVANLFLAVFFRNGSCSSSLRPKSSSSNRHRWRELRRRHTHCDATFKTTAWCVWILSLDSWDITM